MIIIEKSYYSEDTEQITIVIKNTDSFVTEVVDDIYSIKLIRSNGVSEFDYTAIASESVESENGVVSVLLVDVATGITKNDVDYPDFSIDGITGVEVRVHYQTLKSYMYNPEELYSMKVEMYQRLDSINFNMVDKALVRFAFLESAMIDASDLGAFNDAQMFYAELVKLNRTYRSLY